MPDTETTEDQKLEKVKEFARTAHGTQMRKYSSEPYIVHPIRVMELCKEYTTDEALLATALLHDVLEDTPVTKKEMSEFLIKLYGTEQGNRILQLVIELTDVYIKEDYPHLNRQKRKEQETDRLSKVSADAQTVKCADILDNSREIVIHDRQFASRFLKEVKQVLLAMKDADPNIHLRSLKQVEDGLKSLRSGRNR